MKKLVYLIAILMLITLLITACAGFSDNTNATREDNGEPQDTPSVMEEPETLGAPEVLETPEAPEVPADPPEEANEPIELTDDLVDLDQFPVERSFKNYIGDGNYALFFVFHSDDTTVPVFRYLGFYEDGKAIMISVQSNRWEERFGSHEQFAVDFRFGGGYNWRGEGIYYFDNDSDIVLNIVNQQSGNEITVDCQLVGSDLHYHAIVKDTGLPYSLIYEYVGSVKDGVLTFSETFSE